MKIYLSIFTILFFIQSSYGQHRFEQGFFGLQLKEDSTFSFVCRLPHQVDWVDGTWTSINDTIYFSPIIEKDTLRTYHHIVCHNRRRLLLPKIRYWKTIKKYPKTKFVIRLRVHNASHYHAKEPLSVTLYNDEKKERFFPKKRQIATNSFPDSIVVSVNQSRKVLPITKNDLKKARERNGHLMNQYKIEIGVKFHTSDFMYLYFPNLKAVIFDDKYIQNIPTENQKLLFKIASYE